MHKLSQQQILERLNQLNSATKLAWVFAEDRLQKTFEFRDFKIAFNFMEQSCVEAEKLNHHPDWCNSYNKISIELMTHSAGGLTELDFRLAEAMEKISSEDKLKTVQTLQENPFCQTPA